MVKALNLEFNYGFFTNIKLLDCLNFGKLIHVKLKNT